MFWKYYIIYSTYNIICNNHAMYHLVMYFICGIKPYIYMFIIIWKSCLCLDIKAIISLISCPNIYEIVVIINLYVYSNKLNRLATNYLTKHENTSIVLSRNQMTTGKHVSCVKFVLTCADRLKIITQNIVF